MKISNNYKYLNTFTNNLKYIEKKFKIQKFQKTAKN